MTRDAILQHIEFLAQWDPSYAAKALKWYDGTMPWLGLIPKREGLFDECPI